MADDNIILLTDSYKLSHFCQYPPGTQRVYSYFESRGGRFPEVLFFGLQYFIKKYLEGQVVTQEKIDEAAEIIPPHMAGENHFNRKGWEYILKTHGGRLPVVIKAVPEGTVVPVSNVMMTIENTDPNCYWLTNYLETLLVQVWYPCTVATQSRAMKQVIFEYLERTGTAAQIEFKLHDFGFRGVSSVETAGIGGASHLVNFTGTDTLAGIMMARKYYGAKMPGYSIPASEHSTITSWGQDHEIDAMRNMLDQYPNGFVACVSDSFDIYRACSDYWGGILKDKIVNRNGTLVVRPDSGDPPIIVCEVLERLGKAFGVTTNDRGFKVLPPCIRVIQGDGIDFDMLGQVLARMEAHGWSADNVAFGSGGGLLQKVNRDTQKFAFKCSSIQIGDEWRDVFKQPVTDSGKKSKAGKLKLIKFLDGFKTLREEESKNEGAGFLVPVFLDGKTLNEQKFEEIRQRANL